MEKNKLVFESLEEFQNTGWDKWLKEFRKILEEEHLFADIIVDDMIEYNEKELFNLYDLGIDPEQASELYVDGKI
jgi:hypothetical protein